MALDSLIVDGYVHLESLEEVHYHKDYHCNENVVEVG